ncbi:O-methyltransferase [Penicillium riverlandense]|uniref:O-methyltransferase n=1 Tax=Penicillium riverlandense TaxID=1903569 RepID=UPI002546C592|nr:O-methyltransferase [Penicillium riverlandense]KAJ5808759.1 O-methyltransferase [Penicillium riverlandense]
MSCGACVYRHGTSRTSHNVADDYLVIRRWIADDSVLLINENTIPETGVPRFNASVDLIMMTMFSSLERTDKEWLSFGARAHFKVVKVWRADNQGAGSNALFEAVPV